MTTENLSQFGQKVRKYEEIGNLYGGDDEGKGQKRNEFRRKAFELYAFLENEVLNYNEREFSKGHSRESMAEGRGLRN